MRLGEIYEILHEERGKVLLNHKNNNNNYTVSNIVELRKTVTRLSKIKALASKANAVLGQLPFAKSGENLSVTSNLFGPMNSHVAQLNQTVNILYETLNVTIEKPEEGTVYFKLPSFNTLHELNDEVKLLEDNFSQIFGCLDSSVAVKLKGFDVGSAWLMFSVGSAAVAFFAGTLIAAMKVAQEVMDTKIKLNQFESSNDDAKAKKKVDEALNLLIDNVAKKEAERLVELYHADPSKKTAEDALRVANGLRNLANLFVQGGDVQFPRITQNQIDKSPSNNTNENNITEISKKLESSFKELLSLPSPDESNQESKDN